MATGILGEHILQGVVDEIPMIKCLNSFGWQPEGLKDRWLMSLATDAKKTPTIIVPKSLQNDYSLKEDEGWSGMCAVRQQIDGKLLIIIAGIDKAGTKLAAENFALGRLSRAMHYKKNPSPTDISVFETYEFKTESKVEQKDIVGIELYSRKLLTAHKKTGPSMPR